MAKVRSPRYPGISLEEAVSKVQAVYNKEHKHPADREVVAKSLGYGGINGASLTAISALLKYGLLENAGTQLKVTDQAETILLLSKGQPERVTALREAAFSPELFSELRGTFGDKLPSDENLRFSLVKKGFNPNTVDGAIRAYRDTIGFVNAEEALTSNALNSDQRQLEIPAPTEPPMQPQVEKGGSPPLTDDNNNQQMFHNNGRQDFSPPVEYHSSEETLIYRISEDCKARIQFDGAVTLEGIKKLIAFLELGADNYPQKDQQKQSAISDTQESEIQKSLS